MVSYSAPLKVCKIERWHNIVKWEDNIWRHGNSSYWFCYASVWPVLRSQIKGKALVFVEGPKSSETRTLLVRAGDNILSEGLCRSKSHVNRQTSMLSSLEYRQYPFCLLWDPVKSAHFSVPVWGFIMCSTQSQTLSTLCPLVSCLLYNYKYRKQSTRAPMAHILGTW